MHLFLPEQQQQINSMGLNNRESVIIYGMIENCNAVNNNNINNNYYSKWKKEAVVVSDWLSRYRHVITKM